MSDSDSWKKMERAKEDAYFEKQNQEALKRFGNKGKPRLSPITGKPMEEVTFMGVAIDQCPDSGGIWLDAGEFEALLGAAKSQDTEAAWLTNFFQGLFGLYKK